MVVKDIKVPAHRLIFYTKVRQLENKRISTVAYLARLQILEEDFYALGDAPTPKQIHSFCRKKY